MPVKTQEATYEYRHVYAQDSAPVLDKFCADMDAQGWELLPMSRIISFDGTQNALTVAYVFRRLKQ